MKKALSDLRAGKYVSNTSGKSDPAADDDAAVNNDLNANVLRNHEVNVRDLSEWRGTSRSGHAIE